MSLARRHGARGEAAVAEPARSPARGIVLCCLDHPFPHLNTHATEAGSGSGPFRRKYSGISSAHSSVASTPARTQCVFSRTFACASRSSLVSAPSTPASFRVKPISDCCGPSRRRCASRRRNAAGQAPKCCPHGSACATSLASVARSVACGVLTRSRLRSVRFVCGELIETWPALSRYVHTRVYRARARPTDFFPFPCQRVASHFTIFTAQRTQGTRGVPFLCTLEIFRKKCGKERRRQKYANYSRTAAAMHINANLDTLIWNAHQR